MKAINIFSTGKTLMSAMAAAVMLGFCTSCNKDNISDIDPVEPEEDSVTYVYQVKYAQDYCAKEDSLAYIESYKIFYGRIEEYLIDKSIDSLDGFAVKGPSLEWCDSIAHDKGEKVVESLSGVNWAGHFGFGIYNWMTHDSIYSHTFDSPATNEYKHKWIDPWYWILGEMEWDTNQFMTNDNDSYITDIAVFGCSSRGQRQSLLNTMAGWNGKGYVMASDAKYCCDLNENAGGWYIYMGLHFGSRYGTGNNAPITDIVFLENPTTVPETFIWRGRTYHRAARYSYSNGTWWNGDLNTGAGGWYVYCYYTRDYTGRILTCESKDQWGARLFWNSTCYWSWNQPVDNQRINCAAFASYNLRFSSDQHWYHDDNPDYGSLDLNVGAGGDYIYCTPRVKIISNNLTPSYSTVQKAGAYKTNSSNGRDDYKINDNNNSTCWSAPVRSGSPAWIIFESMADSIAIGGYNLTIPSGINNNISTVPTAWRLYASNDMNHWIKLDETTLDNSNLVNNGSYYRQTFNHNRYKYFKLEISKRYANMEGDVQIAEFKLHGAALQVHSANPSSGVQNLFDNNYNSAWGNTTTSYSSTTYSSGNPYNIIWKASHYTKIKKYHIATYGSAPQGWKLMGCQENSPYDKDWVVLDEANVSGTSFDMVRTIPDEKAGFFQYYKWVPTKIYSTSERKWWGLIEYSYYMWLHTLEFDSETIEILTGNSYANNFGQAVINGDLDLSPTRAGIMDEASERHGYTLTFPNMHYLDE